MFEFVGGDFTVVWNPVHQKYTINYKGKYFGTEYRFGNVKCYLGRNYTQRRID